MKNYASRRFVFIVIIIIGISLGVFYLIMSPPLSELGLMALFLLITSLFSSLAGYVAYRLRWLQNTPSIRWTLASIYIISSALTFFNVWFSARLMFASQHDLLLATVLLIFAGGIAIALGFFLSSTITDRIKTLKATAQSLAQGNLKSRVEIDGRDEISDLAKAFNQMAAQLQEAQQKQEQMEQMRKDLIAWISHDLQTPLTSIRAILEALADGVVDDPSTEQRYLQTAQREVLSLSHLIDDLFQLAQLDAGGISLDIQASSLSDLISDTIESFTEIAVRKGIQISGDVSADIDPVNMDSVKIGRVLNNLVNNAIQYTPKGGNVEIKARRMQHHEIEVLVCDSGEGISSSDLPHIFERFYRGEKSRSRFTGGAGLGLAIARGIVLAHQGNIKVSSSPQEGTSFIFTIPDKKG